jgi:hypothetical protein
MLGKDRKKQEQRKKNIDKETKTKAPNKDANV